MKIKNLTDIPKEVFEKVYLSCSISETVKKLKIGRGSVFILAKKYNLSKVNVMR